MNRYFQELFYQANAGSYWQKRSLFYPLKHKLLQRYGTEDGWDRQCIVKYCYACEGTGVYVNGWGIADECWRCNNGIYSQKLIRLNRYKLGDPRRGSCRIYHVPQSCVVDPEDANFNQEIDGIIQHCDRFIIDGWRACQTLLLRYAPLVLLAHWRERLNRQMQWRKIWFLQQCQSLLGKKKLDETPF